MRRRKGSTDVITYFKLVDSSTGVPETGLVYNSTGMALYYTRPGAAATSVSAVTQTVTGAHSDGGFVEVSSSNAPGLYRVDWPDAAFATGVDEVVLMVKATGVDPAYKEVDLTDDPPARPTGAVESGTAGSIVTDLAEATDDHYQECFCLFTSGVLAGQCRKVTSYTGSTGTLDFTTAFTEAPTAADKFVLINQ